LPQPSLDPSTLSSSAASLGPSTTTVPVRSQTGLRSSTVTHDDGKWHTSYPAWNETLLGRRSRDWPRPRPRLIV
jgi:hypothetical protein